jgi:hypothetical protein
VHRGHIWGLLGGTSGPRREPTRGHVGGTSGNNSGGQLGTRGGHRGGALEAQAGAKAGAQPGANPGANEADPPERGPSVPEEKRLPWHVTSESVCLFEHDAGTKVTPSSERTLAKRQGSCEGFYFERLRY